MTPDRFRLSLQNPGSRHRVKLRRAISPEPFQTGSQMPRHRDRRHRHKRQQQETLNRFCIVLLPARPHRSLRFRRRHRAGSVSARLFSFRKKHEQQQNNSAHDSIPRRLFLSPVMSSSVRILHLTGKIRQVCCPTNAEISAAGSVLKPPPQPVSACLS